MFVCRQIWDIHQKINYSTGHLMAYLVLTLLQYLLYNPKFKTCVEILSPFCCFCRICCSNRDKKY
jgi:hypothetical protein